MLCDKFPAAASSSEKYDFVETLMYDKNKSVLMRGKLTDEAEIDKVTTVGLFKLEGTEELLQKFD